MDKIKSFFAGRYWNIIIVSFLLLYPLRHAGEGLDLWDAGYNCGNFTAPAPGNMSSVWFFSTFLSNMFGHFLAGLPGGNTYLGINIFTGLTISAGVIGAYFFYTKTIRADRWITALGLILMMSVCYSPTTIVYNHLSNLLLTTAIICIYTALTKDRLFLLSIAGFILGINLFVRFSNLTQAALIIAVWAYVILKKDSYDEGCFFACLKLTLRCLAGYLAAVLIMAAAIQFKYGIGNYIAGVAGLFNMDADADYYTFSYMLKDMILSYIKGLHRAAYVCVFAGAVYAAFRLTRRFDTRKKAVILGTGAGILLTAVLILRGLMQFSFHHYAVVYFTAALFIDMVIVFAIAVLVSKKADKAERLLAILILLQIVVTSVGSNTGISVAMNCMYLSAPYLFLKLAELNIKIGRDSSLCRFASMIVVDCAVVAFTMQCVLFGLVYVYQEGNNSGVRNSYVHDNHVLKGIRMSGDRAELIQDMTDYINENDLAGHEALVYGFVPAIAYYLDMPTRISSWPDLASYSYEAMKEDMDLLNREAKEGIREYPIVIMGSMLETSGIAENPGKTELIEDFIRENGYTMSYNKNGFRIWRRSNEGND